MRELLYLSRPKLDSFFPDRARNVVTDGEAQVSAMSLTARFRLASSQTDRSNLVRSFKTVHRHIERSAKWFTDPTARPGEWLGFELDLGYGTAHRDTALSELDDVVLFGGCVPASKVLQERDLEILLCGSACHLMDRCASAGRMGSGTEWMHRLIKRLGRSDEQNVQLDFQDITNQGLGEWDNPEEIAQWVYHVIAANHPAHQRTCLSGLARVLLNADSPRWTTRLVVATPLYVQYRDFSMRRMWRRSRLRPC